MRKAFICTMISFSILLTGCFLETESKQEGDTQSREEDGFISEAERSTHPFDEELSTLQEMVEQQQQRIEELEREIDMLRKDVRAKADLEMVLSEQQKISILSHVLYDLDEVEEVTGFVQAVEEIDGKYMIQVQYAEWLSGEDAITAVMEEENLSREDVSVPNGFYIKRYPEDVRRYPLSDRSLHYISKQAKWEYASKEDFVQYLQEDQNEYRFYHFYLVNGEISVMVEHYIP